jgi:integrase
MVLIAGCLGLRVSEIVALKWQDFDFAGPGYGQALPSGGDSEDAHSKSGHRVRNRRRYRMENLPAQL